MHSPADPPSMKEQQLLIEQLRQQLAKAESQLAQAQQLGQLGYWEWDCQNQQAWLSDELHRILGLAPGRHKWTYEELIERIHPDDRDQVHQAVRRSLEAPVPYDIECRIALPDGQERVYHTRGKAFFDAAGLAIKLVGTAQDITGFRQIELALADSDAMCHRVFELIPLGVVLTDVDCRFITVNPAWERMTGYSADELSRVTSLDLTYADDVVATIEHRDRVKHGEIGPLAYEKRYVRKDGVVFWAREIAPVVTKSDNGVLQHIAIIEDITAQKETDLTRGEAQKRQREALLQEVHHRVKNNLQGVAGLLERHQNIHPEAKTAFESAIAQVYTLAMLHGIRSQTAKEEVNLCNILGGIIETSRVLSTVPLDFRISREFAPVEVASDESVPIALILNELVSNAIKHTAAAAKGATVSVRIDRDANSATVSIRNEPARLTPGFDFDREAGAGTGLRLVRSLMPSEGGSLRVWEPAENVVEAELRLWAPVLNLPACN